MARWFFVVALSIVCGGFFVNCVYAQENDPKVEAAFVSFTNAWLDKVERSMISSPDHPIVKREGDGFVASYAELVRENTTRRVKRTNSPSAPYVGVFRYYELHYECRAASKKAALGGEFVKAKKVRVTEIFRYYNGKWKN